MFRRVFFAFAFLMTCSCMSAADHSRSLHSANDRDLTLGVVQKEITRGMAQAEIVQALGSPNIITKDNEGHETWVYDKIATEASYSSDRGGLAGAGGGVGTPGSSLILGGIFGDYNRAAGASATTQRTLTVVIKFDKAQRVRDFSYHTSKF